MKFLALVLLMISSCGPRMNRSIDPRVEEYVLEFEKEYGVYVNYEIKVDYVKEGYVGWCKVDGDKTTVVIDQDYYEIYQNNYGAIHQLVFHELGHCSLYLDHNDAKNDRDEHVSIMNSYVFGMYHYYIDNLDYYLESLVDHRAVPWGASKEWGCKHGSEE